MLTVPAISALAVMLFTKHFIADGPLQTRYQLANKGTFLHPGGLYHAGAHVALSAVCLCVWLLIFADHTDLEAVATVFSVVLALEFVCHYLIDFAKANAEQANDWSTTPEPDAKRQLLVINDAMFFNAFLADQLLHNITYVGMIALIAIWI